MDYLKLNIHNILTIWLMVLLLYVVGGAVQASVKGYLGNG